MINGTWKLTQSFPLSMVYAEVHAASRRLSQMEGRTKLLETLATQTEPWSRVQLLHSPTTVQTVRRANDLLHNPPLCQCVIWGAPHMGVAPASCLATPSVSCWCLPKMVPRKKKLVVRCIGLTVRVGKRIGNVTASLWERLREHFRH